MLKAMRISVVFVALLLPACALVPATSPEALDTTATLQHEGVERTYHVHFPPGFDETKKHPLVLALHGHGATGASFDQLSGGTITAAADKRGFIVVFPEGINKHWNDGRPEHLETTSADDLGFLSTLIALMEEQHGADPKRIFVTGLSNGGVMSYRLTFDLSDQIAATAVVVAPLTDPLKERTLNRPVPVLIMNGTEDPIAPYDGGEITFPEEAKTELGADTKLTGRGALLSTAATVARFRELNGCDETPTVTQLPDKDPDDGTTVRLDTYSGCDNGTEVILVTIVGGGHLWPGGAQVAPKEVVGRVSRDFNGSEMMFDFFQRHPKK